MTGFEWTQDLIIGVILAACILHVVRKLLPRWVNGMQLKLSIALSNPERPATVRRVGVWLQPALSSGGGCGSGCSSCSSCESNPQKEETKPLQFHRHI